jgi:chromosome condensin MukBEF ATPase and DNA-binding subunit MukB
MMGMQTNRAKELVKLLDKLVKQDHLFSDEKLKEMKAQLRVVKEELAQMEAKYSKGFGKK